MLYKLKRPNYVRCCPVSIKDVRRTELSIADKVVLKLWTSKLFVPKNLGFYEILCVGTDKDFEEVQTFCI